MTTAELKRKGVKAMTYAIASGLVGFRSSSLRVRVERTQGDYAWVRTADLLDAGTPLVLNASQLEPQSSGEVVRHKSGLVALA